MMKKLALLLTALLAAAAFAQDGQPAIAVYVTGDLSGSEKRVLEAEMLNALVRTGNFSPRKNFTAEAEKEGAVDDSLICELGKQSGVRAVCVADVTAEFGLHLVAARVLSTKTGKVLLTGKADGLLNSMQAVEALSNSVVKSMGFKIPVSAATPKPVIIPEQATTPAVWANSWAAQPFADPAAVTTPEPIPAPEPVAAIPEPIPAAISETKAEPEPVVETEEFRSLQIRINFEPGGTALTPSSAAELDSVAPVFKQDARRRYEVHGHFCPDAGDQSGAMQFSIRRVAATVNFLLKSDVPSANIVTIINPAPGNAAAGECTHDRRVDIMSIETRIRERKPEPVAVPEPIPAPEPVATPPDPVAATTSESTPAPDAVGAATSRPTLAIYMAGQEPQGVRGVHSILGGELARTISESEKYSAVDRTDDILKQIEKEHVYQRSGAVDDEQIKALGQQLGANFLCISNINPVGKRSYYLDARLVDVVTAEIIRTATATSSLRDANEMHRAARDIAYELIETEKARAQRLRKKRIFRYTSIGLDLLSAGAFAYGIMEDNNINKLVKSGEYPDAVSIAQRRDAAYIAGSVFIAAGLTIHIFF